MRAVAFCGSARMKGNTYTLLQAAIEPLFSANVETEVVELAEQRLSGCRACFECFKNRNNCCVIEDDRINEYIEKMANAEVIILGSPTYFANVSSEMKALIDRCGMVSRANGDMFRRKIGAAVVAVRRAGAVHTYDAMNHFFLIGQMIVVGSSYWNIGIGREIGDVAEDAEGLATMRDLGENVLWLLQKINNKR